MFKIYLIALIVLLAACSPIKQKVEQISTIDNTLQVMIDSILQNKLSELDVTKGQVIVMEVQTGEIKASVGSDFIFQESGLVRTAGSIGNKGSQTIRYNRC